LTTEAGAIQQAFRSSSNLLIYRANAVRRCRATSLQNSSGDRLLRFLAKGRKSEFLADGLRTIED